MTCQQGPATEVPQTLHDPRTTRGGLALPTRIPGWPVSNIGDAHPLA